MKLAATRQALEASAPAREFAYTAADFERVRELIGRRAGIALSEHKRELVYSRLGRRLRALDITDVGDYLDRLEDGRDSDEWQNFINALTTNLTAFFREEHHFGILAEHMQRVSARPFRIWCCAASTGEEPYSLAMTAVETLGEINSPVRIVASDLDTQVLKTAAKGIYSVDRLERMATQRVRRFFLKGTGANEGYARVRPELQKLVEFRQINLLDSRYPVERPIDALFCRNVMIYFDRTTQRQILQRFAALLAPQGLLFAGHSESFLHSADLFRSRGRTVYELSRPQS